MQDARIYKYTDVDITEEKNTELMETWKHYI